MITSNPIFWREVISSGTGLQSGSRNKNVFLSATSANIQSPRVRTCIPLLGICPLIRDCRGRNYCKRVNKASHYSQKTCVDSSYYINEILEKELKPAFSRAATSIDLTVKTVKKPFSSNRDGWFQQDGARAHTLKAPITWLKNNIEHYISKKNGFQICQICL